MRTIPVQPEINAPSTSPQKIEANQSKSQLSPGPKSAQGKKTSSLNALKHGLLAKDVVITNRAGKEDQTALAERPSGPLEIESHATLATKSRRIHTARSQDVASTPTDVPIE
jgi:hypothetical protein